MLEDQRVEGAASEEPMEDALPAGDAPFRSSAQDVSDKMAAALDNADEGDAGEGDESDSESSDADAGRVAEKADDEDEGDDEVRKILKKSEPKDNVQKRIDQLTARLKSLEEENKTLKTSKETKSESKDVEYTDAQLKTALRKAMEDGDSDLVFEIMDYRVKKSEKDLVKRYESVEKERTEAANRINSEWQKVTGDYAKVWEDDEGNEIYQGAQKELDITLNDSLLYQVALDLYHSKDSTGNFTYRVPGGQRMAVADALAAILKQRRLQPQKGKVKQLERSLAKEKRKKSLAGSGSMEEDAPKRTPSADETLAEVIAERRKFQRERGK